ncbi:MAG: hypothetical protein Q4D02_01320 [Clostridia bacterium]|nr:hypothetical protein [Clostridia bacterium]
MKNVKSKVKKSLNTKMKLRRKKLKADSKQNHRYRYAMYKGIEKIKIIHG